MNNEKIIRRSFLRLFVTIGKDIIRCHKYVKDSLAKGKRREKKKGKGKRKGKRISSSVRNHYVVRKSMVYAMRKNNNLIRSRYLWGSSGVGLGYQGMQGGGQKRGRKGEERGKERRIVEWREGIL